MKIYISGNPLNRKSDTSAIYTQPNNIPPLDLWDGTLNNNNEGLSAFIANLYFITMEQNGFCYFYPDNEANTNLCRFEWHYPFKGEEYFLRVGLCFKVKESKAFDITYSIQQHEQYEDIKKVIDKCPITDDEINTIKKFISTHIETANKRTVNSEKEIYNRLYYFQSNKIIKELVRINNSKITLMPSYTVDHQAISLIILPSQGFSYLDSQRSGDEEANLFLAFYTLAIEYIKLYNNDKFPCISGLDYNNEEIHMDKVDSFYPSGSSIEGIHTYLKEEDINTMNWLYESFSMIKEKQLIKKTINLIFAYYSAIDIKNINRTLSLIGLVACMNSVSKILESDYFSENGDRKTIVFCLSNILHIDSNTKEYKLLDQWSKRIYNDHRSSFVHVANHRFTEYSQNMDGNNYAGLPEALPTNCKPFSKQYEYTNDFNIALKVSKLMVFQCLWQCSELPYEYMDKLLEINFAIESIAEGYVGMVNNGWHKMT